MKVKEYFISEDYEPIRRKCPTVVKHGDRTTAEKRLRSSTGDLDRITGSCDSRGAGSPSSDSAHTPAPHSKLTTEQSVRDAILQRQLLPKHIIDDLNHAD